MAESAEPLPDPGWFVEDLVSTLVLAHDCSGLVERWSVTAELPLDELLVELDVDGPPPRLRPPGRPGRPIAQGGCDGVVVDAHGAEITADDWPPAANGRRVVNVRLPRPLLPAETHAFDLTLRLPRSHPFTRHVVVPPVRCRRLELRVHFGRAGAPSGVSRVSPVDGVTGAGGAPRTPVDRAGDVAATFADLRPGRAYGVAW
jgi:hypothetical protein